MNSIQIYIYYKKNMMNVHTLKKIHVNIKKTCLNHIFKQTMFRHIFFKITIIIFIIIASYSYPIVQFLNKFQVRMSCSFDLEPLNQRLHCDSLKTNNTHYLTTGQSKKIYLTI